MYNYNDENQKNIFLNLLKLSYDFVFPDHLLEFHNLSTEVRSAPGNVTVNIQIESVGIGEGRNGKDTADESQIWNAAENSIGAIMDPSDFPTHRESTFLPCSTSCL